MEKGKRRIGLKVEGRGLEDEEGVGGIDSVGMVSHLGRMEPTVIVLGGPNGAGKTTFARQLLLSHLPESFEFLNADMIADGLSPFRPHKAAMRAGREFFRRFDEKVSLQESFVVESTLSGSALAQRLKAAMENGYRVELVYLWLPNVDLAKARVAQRVARGGHDIPKEVIERRFYKSFPNFVSKYLELACVWQLVDGSETPPVQVARGVKRDSVEVLDAIRFEAMGADLLSGGGAVFESETCYGRELAGYTSDLKAVLEKVGEFLEALERCPVDRTLM